MAKILDLDEGVEPMEVMIGGQTVAVTHPADLPPEVMDRFAALGDLGEEGASLSDGMADEMRAVARAIAPGLPEEVPFMRVVRFLRWYADEMSAYMGEMATPKGEAPRKHSRLLRGLSRP